MITKDYSFLLERPEWTFDEAGIDAALAGKRILITGAGGSIGSALARRVIDSSAANLLCVGHSELPIFNLRAALVNRPVEYGVWDVGSETFASFVLSWRPDYVLHAAAHKHVGLMESQPEQALKNNTEATIQLSKVVAGAGGKLIFISTDKAANPTSVMGASKRLAEAWLLAHDSNARICRFGNVLGSSGSLLEIIERRIAEGKPITLTSADMVRYFITAKEAVGLVLSTLLFSPGMYALEMGKQIPIVNIVAKLPCAEVEFAQPGSGEKLVEEILGRGEHKVPTSHPGIFKVECSLGNGVWVNTVLKLARRNPTKLPDAANLL